MKNILLSILLLLSNILSLSAGEITTDVRQKECFNDNWQFLKSDNPQYREVVFDDSNWRTLNVPHDWSIEGSYAPDFPSGKNNGFFEEGIGWYRKTFDVSKDEINKQIVIQFDGVFMNSQVWINGQYLGNRPYGYSTFWYDLTRFLKFGEKNVIAVRVDNSIPGATRWYNGSGIYRNVHLLKTNYVHFKHNGGVYITTPTAEATMGVVKADYELFGSYFTDKEIPMYKKNGWDRTKRDWRNKPISHECIIRSIVYDASGKEVARTEDIHNIKNYQMYYKASQNIDIKNPNRWSADNPYLYTLKSQIQYDGKILDDVVTKFGIRKVEFLTDAGLYINGVQTKLKGVCIHHDAGSLGAAVPEKALRYRLMKLKEMGCNAIRTSHNPFSPEFYELCDELGFYVKDEAFDEWTSAWSVNFTENTMGKAMNGYNHLFKQWWRTDLEDMIKRDRNHPSVIMYSIGNEIPDHKYEAFAAQQAKEMVELCHKIDPTRPVTIGDDNHIMSEPNGVTKEMDIVGINYVARYFPETMYADIHKQYPNKLCLGSEVTREICYHTAMRDNHYVIGYFIWTGIDYLGETGDVGRRGWHKALLDLTLNKRSFGALYEVAWSDKPKIAMVTSDKPADSPESVITYEDGKKIETLNRPTFSWNKKDDQDSYVIVYSNTDEVELFLNGKSLGKKRNNFENYTVEFKVPFQAGKLEAVGFDNGIKVSSTILQTTGKAAKIEAKTVFENLKKDGKDIQIIEVNITDENSLVVPNANNVITVNVKGGAKLIGIDSPNQYYTGSFKANSREAMNGNLLITIQSNGKNEKSYVEISAEGLQSTCITEL